MTFSPPRSQSVGKFRPAPGSAPIPVRADMFKAGAVNSGVRKALGVATPPVIQTAEVERSPDTIAPAKNVNELQGQIGQLIAAFQSTEKRDPAVNDTAFWQAYAKLCRAYFESAHPGSWEED